MARATRIHRRTLFAALAVALLALSVGAYLALGRGAEASGEPLLTLSDLPEGAVALSEEARRATSPEDLTHPLSAHASSSIRTRFSEAEASAVLAYESASSFGALVPFAEQGSGGAGVLSFAYAYPSLAAAERAAELLQRDLLTAREARALGPLSGRSGAGLQGHSYALRGDEGDRVIWTVATEGAVLHLVLLNGMDDAQLDGLHAAISEKVATR